MSFHFNPSVKFIVCRSFRLNSSNNETNRNFNLLIAIVPNIVFYEKVPLPDEDIWYVIKLPPHCLSLLRLVKADEKKTGNTPEGIPDAANNEEPPDRQNKRIRGSFLTWNDASKTKKSRLKPFVVSKRHNPSSENREKTNSDDPSPSGSSEQDNEALRRRQIDWEKNWMFIEDDARSTSPTDTCPSE
ncbi:hypothetical protein GWI33_020027 [Rhynchophorus ferrugineus]|uniref:Uncharacterized protein n=1 Tax=Rhynchophorus ferrugineus TaxID=354439 RepID=A0A834HX69_RHYFE|nr:hypothetical protein GWI33_020027 [Rhynchophorus ferrugineus]